jgi:Raf kinase inhibitor-like YbhB/YbcL family protein
MGGESGAIFAVETSITGGFMASMTDTISNAGKLVRHALGAALSSVHAGNEKMVSRDPAVMGKPQLQLSSRTFSDGGEIPVKNTPAGANLSPDLKWSAPPGTAKEVVLICEDPDAPMLKPFVHWILHGIPASITELPAGIPNERELPKFGGAKQGQNGAKTRGWTGPKPPLGHGVHHYHFQLFALDRELGLGPDTTLDQLVSAMKGHVVAEGEIIGTHELTAQNA